MEPKHAQQGLVGLVSQAEFTNHSRWETTTREVASGLLLHPNLDGAGTVTILMF